MSSWLETRLFRATVRTFEDLGFILPSSDLNDAQKGARPDAAVEIAFRGIFSGRLVLRVFGPILSVVVGNMLGEDESEMPREAQLDALGELANVICGNVLPAIAGDRETFALTPPALLTEISGPRPAWAGIVSEVLVGLDEGRAEVRLYLEGEIPAEARAEAA
jgi:CheY-specific phosphatase CheX